jgi:hypothetical protein
METIRVLFIFEVMGRPLEHVKESLEKFINTLDDKKEFTVAQRKFHEPKPVEKEGVKDFYSAFAEVEIVTEDITQLFLIVLNMLPSHVEILSPSEIRMKNFDISEVLSSLAMKLHKYDEVTKVMTFERNQFEAKVKELEEKLEKSKNEEKGEKDASPEDSIKKQD